MIDKYNNKSKYSKGYTLLFAVLVSALTLAIGISILNISKKEFLLSSATRESGSSFYAADSGLECAVYWDGYGSLSTSTQPLPPSFTCNRISITSNYTYNATDKTYTFPFYIHFGENSETKCAAITVTKSYVNNLPRTQIESRGYNMGWQEAGVNSNCDGVSAKKTERALRITY